MPKHLQKTLFILHTLLKAKCLNNQKIFRQHFTSLDRKWEFVFPILITFCFLLFSSFAYSQSFPEIQKIAPPDGAAGDQFGGGDISISGDVAILGSYADDDNGSNSGSAYIYRYNGTTWILEQKITPSDAEANEQFGLSASISGDIAIVGAHFDNGSNMGAAYIYRYNGTTWVEEQKITASDAASADLFGRYVSISGNVVIVGAYFDDDNGTDSGSAYIYRYNGSSWIEEQKITASDGAVDDEFGHSVSIFGNVAIVGAWQNDNNGSAYIYRYNGTTWMEEQKVTASDGAAFDAFSYEVSISDNVAIVGAWQDDDNGLSSGSAYIYRYNGTTWVEEQKITASDAAANDQFGLGIGISRDVAIVGAFRNDDKGTDSGSAYIYRYNGTTWIEEQKITASDGAANDRFGTRVSMSGDVALVGAYFDDDNGTDSGSAYFFGTPGPSCSFTSSAPSCLGSVGSGSIVVDLGGNNEDFPYTYNYTGPTSGTGSSNSEPFSITSLVDGSYNITLTNSAGEECSGSAIVSSIPGSFFEITQIATVNEGGGGGNGSMNISLSGGSPNYTFSWTGPSAGNSGAVGTNSYTIANLVAGDYAITVTESGGETASTTITILNEGSTTQCNNPVDVLILNDVSGSVDATEYSQSKQFFVDFATALNIGPGATDSRMGIAEWSNTGRWQERLPIGSSLAALQNYRGYSRPFAGGTNPQDALSRGLNYMASRVRPNVPKVLVIATDASQHQVSNSLISISKQFQAQGFTVVTIAFDDAYSNSFTRNILAQAATPGFTYGASAYSGLSNDLASRIVNLQVCTANPGSSNTVLFQRDGTLDITGISAVGTCPNITSVTVDYTVCAQQQLSLPAGIPVSFYHGNPVESGASYLLTTTIPCAIAAGTCENFSIDLPLNGPTNLYAILNDNGSQVPPIAFPNTGIQEIGYQNNIDSEIVTDPACAAVTVVALKRALTSQPLCGNTALFKISVCNIGTAPASDVNIVDVAPVGFSQISMIENLNGCTTKSGSNYNIDAGCCMNIILEYDATAAAIGVYDDQDVILSGPGGVTYLSYEGASSGLEDIEVTGIPYCPSNVVNFTQAVNTTEICEESFVTYSFTIDNQTEVALQNLSFDMSLPLPVIFAAEPYQVNNISMGETTITGSNVASFLIGMVPPKTVGSFEIDVYLGDWSGTGTLNVNARLSNLPAFVNGSGADLVGSSPSVIVNALPDVEAGLDQAIIVGNSANLSGTINNGTIDSWQTSGDGTFDNAASLSANYTPGPTDITNGYATLSLSADASSTVCFDDLDTLRITLINCSAGTVPPTLGNTLNNICTATTVDLNSLSVDNKPAGAILTWHNATPATSTNKLPNPSAVGLGTYYAAFYDTVNDCYSGNGSATSPVTVNVLPNITGRDTTICGGETIDLSTMITGSPINTLEYRTTYGSYGSSNSISPISTTTYFVRDSSIATGCADTASVQVLIDAGLCTMSLDWGDLPDPSTSTALNDYQTVASAAGPSHVIIAGLSLGINIDAEPDGQPSTDALGDGADEDGLQIWPNLYLVPGLNFQLPFSYTNTTPDTAHIEAWIDWNGDGDFDDVGEMVVDTNDGAGTTPLANVLPFSIPTTAATNTLLGLRIRISHQDNMTPYGMQPNGEIEDYLIGIDCPQVCFPVSARTKK